GMAPELPVYTLAPALEQVLQDSVNGQGAALEPGLAERLHQNLGECVRRQESRGEPAVLLVPGGVRAAVARLVRHSVPSLAVLAYAEVPEDKRLRLVGSVGGGRPSGLPTSCSPLGGATAATTRPATSAATWRWRRVAAEAAPTGAVARRRVTRPAHGPRQHPAPPMELEGAAQLMPAAGVPPPQPSPASGGGSRCRRHGVGDGAATGSVRSGNTAPPRMRGRLLEKAL